MSTATRRTPLPGCSFTGDEIFFMARDYLGFSWRLDTNGVTILHNGEKVAVVTSVQSARVAICDYAVGMIRAGAEPADEVDLESP